MIFTYLMPILLGLLIYRYWQLKKSIRKRKYDYSYYEEGPYAPKKRKKKSIFTKIKKFLGLPSYFLALILSLSFSSCQEKPRIQVSQDYQQGVFCINEGIFGQTSGTISYYNTITQKSSAKIFHKANNRDLGNVVQSMTFVNDKAYIIVNNSNKIEVADANTFVEKAQIIGLFQPRYMVKGAANTAYVSQWGADGISGSIATIDLQTHQVIHTLPVGKGPEKLYFKDNKLYVPLVGGYDTDRQIIVINTLNQSIEDTLIVSDNPSSCLEDANGNIWILCGGKTVYSTYPAIDTAASTASAIVQIAPLDNSIIYQKTFGKGQPATLLSIDKNQGHLYYHRNHKIWKYDISTQNETPIISGSFYGLGFNPNDNYIYAATNLGINMAFAKRYQSSGVLVDSFEVGVFANGFIFK